MFQRSGGDLSSPQSRVGIGIHYDPDAFGRVSESLARFFGTARYLFIQTVIVIIWLAINIVAVGMRWDPYPFILLNLLFSTQAAYAAPLILLAQNRQDARDRSQSERDRETSARILSDTDYLARELAAIRLALTDTVTSQDVAELHSRLDELSDQLAERDPAAPDHPS